MRGRRQAFVSFRRSQIWHQRCHLCCTRLVVEAEPVLLQLVICQKLNSTGGMRGVSVLEVGIDLLYEQKFASGSHAFGTRGAADPSAGNIGLDRASGFDACLFICQG